MNELINHEAVYRTAPATPGLLNMSLTNVVAFIEISSTPFRVLMTNSRGWENVLVC